MCVCHHFFNRDFLKQSIHGPDESFYFHHHRVPICFSLVNVFNMNNVSGVLFYCGVCAILCTEPFTEKQNSYGVMLEGTLNSIVLYCRLLNIEKAHKYLVSPFCHHL